MVLFKDYIKEIINVLNIITAIQYLASLGTFRPADISSV